MKRRSGSAASRLPWRRAMADSSSNSRTDSISGWPVASTSPLVGADLELARVQDLRALSALGVDHHDRATSQARAGGSLQTRDLSVKRVSVAPRLAAHNMLARWHC